MSSRGNKKRKAQGRPSARAERKQEEKDRKEAHKLWVSRQTKREAKLRICDILAETIVELDPTKKDLVDSIILDYKNTLNVELYHERLLQVRQSIADQSSNNLINRS